MCKTPLFENVDCVSFYVDDIDKGLAFYQKSLGLKVGCFCKVQSCEIFDFPV